MHHVCVCCAESSRKGQRSFGSSVRCVWQTACSSLGQTLSLIQAQSVIGIWIWANNYNVILNRLTPWMLQQLSQHYQLWWRSFYYPFFMIFGNESTVIGLVKGGADVWLNPTALCGLLSASPVLLMHVGNDVFSLVSKFQSKMSSHKLQHCLRVFSLRTAVCELYQ